MRHHKTWISTLAMVVALAMASTAMAAPPAGKGKPDPVDGQTCAEYFETAYQPVAEDFTLTITEKGTTCVDVFEVPAGTWTVDVSMGSAREVTVQLRSSVPGDWCWVEHTKQDASFSLASPKSEAGACPNGGAGGDPIPDDHDALAFTVVISSKKVDPNDPVVVSVTLP